MTGLQKLSETPEITDQTNTVDSPKCRKNDINSSLENETESNFESYDKMGMTTFVGNDDGSNKDKIMHANLGEKTLFEKTDKDIKVC